MTKKQNAEFEIYGSNFNFYWTRIIITPFFIFWVVLLLRYFNFWSNSIRLISYMIDIFLIPILLSIPFYYKFYKTAQKKRPIISLYEDYMTFKLDAPMPKFAKLFNELFIKPKFKRVKYQEIDKIYKYKGIYGSGYYVEGENKKFDFRTSIHTINNNIEMDMLQKRLVKKGVKIEF